ncbi:dnaJ homolog subfamily C member 10-like isoform X1 [Asterias rubens]|uniref:dnaJ homolog subfamily C member 10-like isoform X1 n=1 Tax=Asterias rubens TaxID=7604 RepID=UPI001454E516|nr:dnaJ homolog subfamily C member 10-like isoform X1 [Asterias rubens]
MAFFYRIFTLMFVLLIFCISSSTAQVDIEPASEITKETFQERVDTGDLLLVNFVGPGCKNCKEFAPIFNRVNTELLRESSEVKAVVVNDMETVRRFDIRKIPSVVLFRKSIPILYEGHNEAEEIFEWIGESKNVQGRYLNDDDFEHLTQASTGSTTGDWLVQFCDPERPQCEALIASWEAVAYRLKGKVNVATVDISKNPNLVKRFSVAIERTPYVVFIKDEKLYKLHRKMIYAPSIQLENFMSVGYTESRVFKVPKERTFFDDLTESIANKLKETQASVPGLFVIIAVCLVVLSLVLCKVFCGGSSSRGFGSKGPKKGV